MRGILTFHSIDRTGSVISTEPERFRSQMEWLAAEGPAVVGLSELGGAGDNRSAVALTFDDGFANFATEAWPVLESLKLPVTLFVPTGHVGKVNAWEMGSGAIPVLPLLGWSELGRLAASGVTLGSHGASHVDLRSLSDARLEEELQGSAARIREETGISAGCVAYPYGFCNDRVVANARRTYGMAVTTDFREIRGTFDPWRVPRLDAWYFRRPGRLEQWGTPAFQRWVAVRRTMRGARRLITRS